MNREEAYNALIYSGADIKIIVDAIYDNFENRKCKNCLNFNSGICNKIYTTDDIYEERSKLAQIHIYSGIEKLDADLEVHEDFGCNEFKQKG